MCEVKISRDVRAHTCLDCFHKAHDPGQCDSCNCGESEAIFSVSRQENAEGRQIAVTGESGEFEGGDYAQSDAAQIVREHNAHARLVAALRALNDYYQASGKVWDDARAALAAVDERR